MSRIRRVVLDTSTLVSAALRVGSVPHQAVMKAMGDGVVCASLETMAELRSVLYRPKFDRYVDRESRMLFFQVIRRNAHFVSVSTAGRGASQPQCRDPNDQMFLELALTADADVLVSADKDLLVLHPWRGIGIVTPAEFVAES